MYCLPLLVFNHGFKFQNSICNGCHNLTMLCLNLSDIAKILLKDADYYISKYVIQFICWKVLCLVIVFICKYLSKKSILKTASATIILII